MVYFNPQIENTNFNILTNTTDNKPVKIVYNGSGIHTITGPVPYITINRKTSANDSGYLNSIPVAININGKIVRNGVDAGLSPPGTGIQSILGAIDNLKNLFIGSANNDNYNGVLEIKCGGSTSYDGDTIFSATGVRILNFNADKSADGWVHTADYTIDLEFYENKPNNSGLFIKSCNDDWSIEPIEDYIYSNFSYSITQKPEYHNPLLQPLAPSVSNPAPSQGFGPGNFGVPTLSIQTIPRFKITRQLNAVGVPVGTGNIATNSALYQAKKWVENRLSQSFNNAESGVPYFFQQASIPNNFSYLYNHLRTTNFNVVAGSYQVSETWLAMPTGLKYTEDYSIETSTDEKYIRTVRVQGEIQGLSLVDLSVMSGQLSHLSGSKIDLEDSTKYISQTNTSPILDNNGQFNTNLFSQNKYINAHSGWLHDIKPYLYRRASIVLNSPDRNQKYINPAISNAAPGNPTYCKENLLNIIPLSTSEGHNTRKGTISYTYEYNNKFTYLSGVISESVNIEESNPADVIAETFVLGRRLGPVLQNLGSKTSSQKSVTVEVTVVPPSSPGGFLLTNSECPLYTGGTVYRGIDTLLEGLKPYGDRPSDIFGNYDNRSSQIGNVFKTSDTHSWNPVDGKFTKSVRWTYQPCTNTRANLDN